MKPTFINMFALHFLCKCFNTPFTDKCVHCFKVYKSILDFFSFCWDGT